MAAFGETSAVRLKDWADRREWEIDFSVVYRMSNVAAILSDGNVLADVCDRGNPSWTGPLRGCGMNMSQYTKRTTSPSAIHVFFYSMPDKD